MRVDGQCHCGAIAFEAEVDPEQVRICHCTDCQSMSGSPFRANIVATAGFKILRGAPRTYVKTADSGNKRAQVFCGDCGTSLWSATPSGDGPYTMRVGTIAQRASFKPASQIWCDSALPWTGDIAGVARRARQ